MGSTKEMTIMFPHPPGAGGPGSFQVRFERELKAKGYKIAYKGNDLIPDIIFVVGGTKKVIWLALMRLKRVPVLYRLDGIGWLHKKKKVSLKHFWLGEFRNILSKSIHGFLSSYIVYQSQFANDWWERSGWRKRNKKAIIHNGVIIPDKTEILEAVNQRTVKRLVILEGVIDYSPYAIKLLN